VAGAGVPAADEYWEEHGAEFVAALDGDVELLGALSGTMAAHHPDERHWYLLAIGVDPTQQGRRLGSAVLAHTLAVADEEGVPAYLEATSARSRALYARHGFDVTAELRAGDSPPMWAMWREPAR
jgi:GNAT superfamily N-acetyltransferase